MVNKSTPTTCDNFIFDLGGKEVEHFHQITLPETSIPVVEHNSGASGKRHPTKHAEQPDYGGTFTASLYARGKKNSIDKWWDDLTAWKEGQNQKAISITAKSPDGRTIGRWEFEEANLIRYDYQDNLSGGEAMKVAITVSYRKMKRKKP